MVEAVASSKVALLGKRGHSSFANDLLRGVALHFASSTANGDIDVVNGASVKGIASDDHLLSTTCVACINVDRSNGGHSAGNVAFTIDITSLCSSLVDQSISNGIKMSDEFDIVISLVSLHNSLDEIGTQLLVLVKIAFKV